MRRLRLPVLLALLAAVATAACQDGGEPALPPLPATGPLVATAPLRQDRYDADRHVLTVPVRNDDRGPVTITGLQLASDRFAPLPVQQREDPIAAGQAVDLRLDYGPARCGPPGAAPPVVLVELAADSGRPQTTRVDLPAGPSALDRVHEVECAQQRLAGGFAVTLAVAGPAQVVDGLPALPGVLTVTRRASAEALTVDELGGSLLYDAVLPGGGPVLALEAGQASAARSLGLSLTTCDPHLLIEANAVFRFGLVVRVGGEAPHAVRFDLDEPVRQELARLSPLCDGLPAP